MKFSISLPPRTLAPRPALRDAQADRAALLAVQAAAQSGDMAAAANLAERVLAGGLENPMLLNLAALKLENEGRLEDAAVLLRRARALAPRDIGVLNALGLCLHRLEDYADAVEQFDAALAIQPDLAPGYYNRGAALDAMGRLDLAEADYRRTLELHPAHHPALAGIASLMGRRGDHAGARDLAEKALEIQPNFPDAIMTLAAAEAFAGAADRAIARLRTLIADPNITPVQGALAMGLLGDLLDAQDRTDEAFAAYARCNTTLREAYAGRLGGQRALAYSRELAAQFEGLRPGGWPTGRSTPAATGPARGHVFLTGFPRSGTTLLEQVMASHPDVEALEERETLIDGVRAYLRSPLQLDRLAGAGDAELEPLREAYWRRVSEQGADPAGKVFVDKHPFNTFKLPLIARLFPDAKVLFARRDPRDVVLSAYRRRFRMSGPMFELLSLEDAAAYYDTAMALAGRLQETCAQQVLVVRHESLVADFDAEVKAICGFVGLDWTEAMRGFAGRTRDRVIATPSAAQLSRGLSTEGIGQWRRYRHALAPVLPVLAPWVERFGYERD